MECIKLKIFTYEQFMYYDTNNNILNLDSLFDFFK